jgi:hypothetical protein
MFVVCFIEMVRRCMVHSKETREGKREAKMEEMRKQEELGSQTWEKEE